LYDLKIVEDPQISPDGKHIAFVRMTIDRLGNQYRRHIWLATLGKGAAARVRQFTFGPKSDTSPRWSPDGQRLAFVSARGDKPQIHVIDLAGGEARAVTALPQGATNPVWSPDGRRLAFLSRANADERRREDRGEEPPTPTSSLEARHLREVDEDAERQKLDPRVISRHPYRTGTEYFDDRRRHVYVMEVPAAPDGSGVAPVKPKAERRTDGEFDFDEVSWAPDGRSLLATLARDPVHRPWERHDLARIAARGKRLPVRRLTRDEFHYMAPVTSPDGKWIAALRRREGGGLGRTWRLAVLPARGGRGRDLTLELDRAVQTVRWAADSQGLYFLVEDQGATSICRASAQGEPGVRRVVGGERIVTGYTVDAAGRVAFAAWTPERPADLYAAGAGGRGERRLTDFNATLLKAVQVARPEEVRYRAPDGREIQGWVYRPVGYQAWRRVPLAVHNHGGPHVMWGPSHPGMWLEWQVHAARGYAIFYCNPRGAEGYGEAFAEAIHNDWGDHVMHDILAGVDHVVGMGFVDPKRMAVTGGSYAGYMTAWIVGHDHRFVCAWAQRGLYSLLSFYGTTDVPQLIEREFDMYPFDDVARAWQQSPLAFVRNIRTPLVLEHQDQDYRCPVSEAEQLYTALKRLRRPVTLIRYPREGHEMSRAGEPQHRVDRLNRMTAWFDRYCGLKARR
jgi:dipeptidyl aminopeptidase/acylaminoacyl peptidase